MTNTLRPWSLGIGVCLIATFAWWTLLNHANAKIQFRCVQAGGTVIINPGRPSMCVVRPEVDANTHRKEVGS